MLELITNLRPEALTHPVFIGRTWVVKVQRDGNLTIVEERED